MRRNVVLLLIFSLVASEEFCNEAFCPPNLEKRKITIERDLPQNFIGRDEKSGCNCREAPNIYSVCYNINEQTPCSKFPKSMNFSTKTLILKTTHITKLVFGDFSHFAQLEMLTIDNNQYLSVVEPFIFQNMTSLTTLSFISNPLLMSFDPDTFDGLINLKELNLVKNGFENIYNLASSMRYNVLPSLLRLNLNENIFQNITKEDFRPMEGNKLVELSMASCAIQTIHPMALTPLKSLMTLRIGSNRFDVDTLVRVLTTTIRSGVNLKTLDLYLSGLRASIPESLQKSIAYSNISTLVLTRNQFDILERNLFSIEIPNLTILDLTDVSAQSIHDQAFSKLPNLKTLILANNKLPHFAESKYLANLSYLDIQKNTNPYGSEFSLNKSQLNKMKLHYLDMQFTRLLSLMKTDFGYMPHLKYLSLKNCSILTIENDCFKGMPNLHFLNLGNNLFFKIWMNSTGESDIFRGLENLQILMLEGNSISSLRTPTKHLLMHFKNLKHLGLNKNRLLSICREDFAHLTKLEVLDISENRIISWDSRVFPNNHLKKLFSSHNKITRFSDAMIQDFQNLESVDLDFNSFICDCFMKAKTSKNKSALSRISELIHTQQLNCLRPYANQTVFSYLQNIIHSNLDCDPVFNITLVIFPLLLTFVIFLIVVVVGFIYRWHIRYWLFLIRIHLIRKGKNVTSEIKTDFRFDGFVSYCNQDQNFVMKLVRTLETNEPYLRLCIYERDFQVGSYISESVLEHMSKSRKTILVLSDSFAKSYWCNWESKIVEHHRLFCRHIDDCSDDSIVLIKLGKIDEAHLNPSLRFLLKTRIYLEWDPDDDDKQIVFWRKLRQFLTPPGSDNVFINTYL